MRVGRLAGLYSLKVVSYYGCMSIRVARNFGFVFVLAIERALSVIFGFGFGTEIFLGKFSVSVSTPKENFRNFRVRFRSPPITLVQP